MDCPHCGAETLMGATNCFACGRPMFGRASAPPASPQPSGSYERPPEPKPLSRGPGEAPSRDCLDEPSVAYADSEMPARPILADDGPLPAPVSRPSQELTNEDARPAPIALPECPRRTLCRVCFGPCTDRLTNVCDACQLRASATPGPQVPAAAFGKRLGTAAFRPPPVRRGSSAGARAARAIFWGVLLVGAGFGVVHVMRPPAPGARLARDSSADVVSVAFAMPKDSVLRYTTTLDLEIGREENPSSFDSSMMTIFDLHQVSKHEAEVMLVRDDGDGHALLDVRTTCGLVSQEGEWEQIDGSMRAAYPWPGRIEVERVRVLANGPMTLASGGEPQAARDVPPLLTFGHIGGPVGDIHPGARWDASASLPCLVTGGGALASSPFDCRLRYVGRRVLGGRACAIVQLEATPKRALDERFKDLDGVAGSVSGALAYDLASGLLVQADLEIDTQVWRGGSAPAERVSAKGALRVTRD